MPGSVLQTAGVSPSAYSEALVLNAMVSRSEAFEKELGLDEMMRVGAPGWDQSTYMKRKRDRALYLLHVKVQQAKKKVPTKNKICQSLDPRLPGLQNYEN